jgi:hypothetical protein
MTRREMVEKMLAGMAAGAIWPVIAGSHPLHALLTDGATLDRADAAHHAVDWKPLFLNSQQDQTLVELAETIVPGSAKAQVHRFIDLLLTVDTKDSQEKFVASLADMQSASQEKFGRGFRQLTASEKEELLTHVCADPTHQKHFDDLKEWISTAYYSSEEGMRELGWTGEHAFRALAECSHEG